MNISSKWTFVLLFLTQNTSLEALQRQRNENRNDERFIEHILSASPAPRASHAWSCWILTWLAAILLLRELRLAEGNREQIQVADPGPPASRAWPQNSCATPLWGHLWALGLAPSSLSLVTGQIEGTDSLAWCSGILGNPCRCRVPLWTVLLGSWPGQERGSGTRDSL